MEQSNASFHVGKNHQLCEWWNVVMYFMPAARYALANSPTTSRLGPMFIEFHWVSLESHMLKPSWCSATGPANLAPERANRSAHCSGSNFSAVNMGMKSL